MASTILTQTLQPQVAVAVSHLSSMVTGARAMSSHKESRVRNKSNKKTDKPITSLGKLEPLQIRDLGLLLHDARDSVTTPTTALVQRACKSCQKWENSHTSAASFFENKTGFPRQYLDQNVKDVQVSTQHPLFHKIFHSLSRSHYLQHRGFKTKRSDPKSGVGGENFLENLKDLFEKSRSSKASSQPIGSLKMSGDFSKPSTGAKSESEQDDRQIELLTKAFAKGYNMREEKKKKYYRTMFIIAFSLYILYQMSDITIRSVSESASSVLSRGNSFEVNAEDISVTFADVCGASEAKQELQDVVQFLKDPEKYTALGAKLPKGVLLVGPPGVGKTLLARAVAGEAGVPFFHASGSEFDEMFVGLGAKRIRQLFTAAKDAAPCIIFIDEFDSVGAKRSSTALHPYANQTVNQLLNEMDGFRQNEGIIVMGATNKVENMDKALRRPGRFDVEVTVALPDLKGRKEILELYISKIEKDPNVNVDQLAKNTTGFSGAELENMVNQAALKAVIDGRDTVTMSHLEYSRDKIIMGPERKHRIPDDETNWCTAFHEAGHTLVAFYTKDATPLHKVTIIPRGQSLGHTAFMDEKEVYNRNVAQLKASMDVGMGGRAAEEVIYGPEQVTTGASSDLMMTTKVASAMVMSSGMSEKVGLRYFADSELSPAQREVIDLEIKRLLQESYERAKGILTSHRKELDALANALMKYETLDKDEIKAVVEGKTLDRVP